MKTVFNWFGDDWKRVKNHCRTTDNKNFTENHVLLAGMPASIKKNRKIWYEEDGGIYIERVKRIELLKKQMLYE